MMHQRRHYDRVSDQKRSILIDLMTQNEQVTIREAANLLQINYESAKSIWSVFKRHGRRHNLRNRKTFSEHQKKRAFNSVQASTEQSEATLRKFDRASELL